MQNVILSADSERYLYSVPDKVAQNLEKYCQHFQCVWLPNSIDAKKIIKNRNRYNETHFILYLNTFVFPDEQSIKVKNLGWIDFEKSLPEEYKNIPCYNF